MRILITGGMGFIGSAVVRHVIDTTDCMVTNLDVLTYAANPKNLADLESNPRYSFVKADIREPAQLAKVFKEADPDAVMHLAAESHVDRSIDSPSDFVDTNVVGTVNLLNAARAHWAALPAERKRDFRFHHVSTDEVYGSLGAEGLFTEESRYQPNSPYAASKAASDMMVRAWGKTYGLPVVISNCSNNYGPRQFPEKLIPVIIIKALAGEPLPVYGDGSNVRDWLFVEDHASALWSVLQNGRIGEIYNIGGDAECSNLDLVKMLCAILDEEVPGKSPRENLITFVSDRPGHDFRYAIDASKTRDELGWTPSVSIEQGLKQTVRWYLDNEPWWREILGRGFNQARIGLGEKVAS